MQQSSLVIFCEECSLANDSTARHCLSCQHPLTQVGSLDNPVPLKRTSVAGASPLEVLPDPLFSPDQQDAHPSPICDFQPGSILAERYQIQKEIGRGGFSMVYRALQIKSSRQVAIKRLHLTSLSPQELADATSTFQREMTMLARFSERKGVPRFYEYLTDAENWCLIMQYIPGQTLDEYLQKAPSGFLSDQQC